jgi:hypothetical protein
MRIGVVGYSAQKFDVAKARELLNEAFDMCRDDKTDWVVSGLTDLGIPAVAYRIAEENGMNTMGIACVKAKKHECFPCDRVHIQGNNWGDESEMFLAAIDVLIRVGGGPQSFAEVARAKELGIWVIEKDLTIAARNP